MMSQTMKIINISEVRRLGTEALVKALGPIGMARYLEGYDNSGCRALLHLDKGQANAPR